MSCDAFSRASRPPHRNATDDVTSETVLLLGIEPCGPTVHMITVPPSSRVATCSPEASTATWTTASKATKELSAMSSDA